MKKVFAILLVLILTIGSMCALAETEPKDLFSEKQTATRKMKFRATTGYTWVLPMPEDAPSIDMENKTATGVCLGTLEVSDLILFEGQTLNFYVSSANNFQFQEEDFVAEHEKTEEKNTSYFVRDMMDPTKEGEVDVLDYANCSYMKYNLYLGQHDDVPENIKKTDITENVAILINNDVENGGINERGPQDVIVGTKILQKNAYLIAKIAENGTEATWAAYQQSVTPDAYADFKAYMYIVPTMVHAANKDMSETLTIYAVVQGLPDDEYLLGN